LFIIYAVKPCQADYIRFYKKKTIKKICYFKQISSVIFIFLLLSHSAFNKLSKEHRNPSI